MATDLGVESAQITETRRLNVMSEIVPAETLHKIKFNSEVGESDLSRSVIALNILNEVGIDNINRLVSCDVSEEEIFNHLGINRGDFNIWLMSDPERQIKYLNAGDLKLMQSVHNAKKGALEANKLTPDQHRALKLRLDAAKHVDGKLRDVNPDSKPGTLVSIQIVAGKVGVSVGDS